MDAACYQHSGRAPAGGMLTAVGGGLVVGSVLAFVYAYAVVYVPIAGTVTFLLSGGFGLGTGVAVGAS